MRRISTLSVSTHRQNNGVLYHKTDHVPGLTLVHNLNLHFRRFFGLHKLRDHDDHRATRLRVSVGSTMSVMKVTTRARIDALSDIYGNALTVQQTTQ